MNVQQDVVVQGMTLAQRVRKVLVKGVLALGVIGALVGSVALPTPVAAQSNIPWQCGPIYGYPRDPAPRVTVFRDLYFQGDYHRQNLGEKTWYSGPLHDSISSICIPGGYGIQVYKDIAFGKSRRFENNSCYSYVLIDDLRQHHYGQPPAAQGIIDNTISKIMVYTLPAHPC